MKLLSHFTNTALLLISFMVLIGWGIDSHVFKSIFPGLAVINPLTAVCFIAVTISLLLLQREAEEHTEKKKNILEEYLPAIIVFSSSMFVGFIGILTIAGFLNGVNLGFDRVLFSDRLLGSRISFNTGLNFIIVGCALFFLTIKSRQIILITFTFLLAVVSYAYSIFSLYQSATYIPVELNTAFMFMLLCVGIFSVHSKKGLSSIVTKSAADGGVLATRLLFAVILIPFALGYLRLLGQEKGFYSSDLGLMALIILNVTIFIGLALITAIGVNKADIKRKRAENLMKEQFEALEIEKAKDKAILESIGDGLIAVDVNGKVIMINEQAERLLNVSRADSIGKYYYTLWSEEDAKGNTLVLEKRPIQQALIRGEKIANSDYYYVRPDKEKIPVAVTASPVKLNNIMSGIIVVFRDITQEKELNRLKDEFVSIASHELRTPMTAIKGLVSMIMEGDFGKIENALTEPLSDISNSTERLIHLVNDMLNVSRIESGRLKFDLSTFEINKEVNEMVNLLRPIAKNKNITLNLASHDQILVQADVDKTKQVLNNLLGNALKFTDQGSITVSCKKENEIVEIKITDTGSGISKEDQQKLFGKFQQISSQQAGRPTGSGLGLYISRELVRKMGGDLWIGHSEPGIGSSFIFSLPLSGSGAAEIVKKEIQKEAFEHPDQRVAS